jgi:phenylacetate-CoA ligase
VKKTFLEIYAHARKHSPYYRALYASLPEGAIQLSALPIVEQGAFWAANQLENNQVLTGPMSDGVVYKSGGTTGNPKFSVFTRNEWKVFTESFGWGLNQGGLARGQRVANLFYAGELYASFLFITASIAAAPEPALMLPISGATDVEEVAKTVRELKANVLAGAPTTILALAGHLEKTGQQLPSVQKILFGGESAYGEQRNYLQRIFNNCEVRSIGYASVDAGLLGYADLECEAGEHRCFDGSTILELIDEETGEVIEEIDRPGKILITNLTRTLMPILRYPAGDRATWSEPAGTANRKFKLLGRSEEGARIGPATVYFEDLIELLKPFSAELSIQGFQLVLEHIDRKDRLRIRAAVTDPLNANFKSAEVVRTLLSQRPMLAELAEKEFIHVPVVEWITVDQLETNARTGKVKRVIDQRGK